MIRPWPSSGCATRCRRGAPTRSSNSAPSGRDGNRSRGPGKEILMKRTIVAALALCLLPAALSAEETGGYDLVLRGGTIYDGSGGKPFIGDVAVNGDRIVAVGAVGKVKGRKE